MTPLLLAWKHWITKILFLRRKKRWIAKIERLSFNWAVQLIGPGLSQFIFGPIFHRYSSDYLVKPMGSSGTIIESSSSRFNQTKILLPQDWYNSPKGKLLQAIRKLKLRSCAAKPHGAGMLRVGRLFLLLQNWTTVLQNRVTLQSRPHNATMHVRAAASMTLQGWQPRCKRDAGH